MCIDKTWSNVDFAPAVTWMSATEEGIHREELTVEVVLIYQEQ
jgi:hypothetical protein